MTNQHAIADEAIKLAKQCPSRTFAQWWACLLNKAHEKQPVKVHAIRDLPASKPVEPEFFMCRKIRYGRNGNFVRYVPVNLPNGIVNATLITHTLTGETSYDIG